MWGWGDNSSGQLGTGGTGSGSVPTQVSGGRTWAAVAAGSNFAIAIATDGSLWAWGDNSSNQLGDGTSSAQSVPEQIVSSGFAVPSHGNLHRAAGRSNECRGRFQDIRELHPGYGPVVPHDFDLYSQSFRRRHGGLRSLDLHCHLHPEQEPGFFYHLHGHYRDDCKKYSRPEFGSRLHVDFSDGVETRSLVLHSDGGLRFLSRPARRGFKGFQGRLPAYQWAGQGFCRPLLPLFAAYGAPYRRPSCAPGRRAVCPDAHCRRRHASVCGLSYPFGLPCRNLHRRKETQAHKSSYSVMDSCLDIMVLRSGPSRSPSSRRNLCLQGGSSPSLHLQGRARRYRPAP